MRKVLAFIKDFGNGVLYLGLMAGFMLLIAAGMYYFKPHEMFSDPVIIASKAKQTDVDLAKRLALLGLKVTFGAIAALWLSGKIEAFWRKRRKSQAEAAAAAPAQAEAK